MAKPRHPRLPQRKSPSARLLPAALLMFGFVVLVLLVLGVFSFPSSSGGSSKAKDLSSILRKSAERSGLGRDEERGEQWVELISWEPRAFLYHNFLVSRVRTSSGTFLARGRDKIIRDIEKRIADFTFIPVEHGEGLQILHYEVGQKYEPHYDYFMDEYSTKNGGQRIATILMYLSDVEEGGETVFPAAKANFSAVPWWNELSDCGKEGLSVKPKKGDALLFWSMKPDGALDQSSLHGGCPVIKGNKWSSTKWLRVQEYKV